MSAPGARPIVFGEVLFDRFPDGAVVLGGAPFNVAWNLQAFGRAPLLISRVGDDDLGRDIRSRMQRWGMDTSLLQVDPSHPTGTVDVTIEDGEPSYEIVADVAYDFIEAADLRSIGDAALIYHGSLALRSAASRAAFEQLIETTGLPRFLDVNLRPPWWSAARVVALLGGARWVKLNEDELSSLAPQSRASDTSADEFRRRFELDAVILTRGEHGALCLTDAGAHTVRPSSGDRKVDTVGAGDAFASVVLLGLLEQWPLPTALERAQTFASAVVGLRGATSEDRGFYAGFTDAWGIGRI
jgi:fructokinase